MSGSPAPQEFSFQARDVILNMTLIESFGDGEYNSHPCILCTCQLMNIGIQAYIRQYSGLLCICYVSAAF